MWLKYDASYLCLEFPISHSEDNQGSAGFAKAVLTACSTASKSFAIGWSVRVVISLLQALKKKFALRTLFSVLTSKDHVKLVRMP